MVNLETVKKCYAEKKNLDKELIEQFKLIGKVLGSIYTYKDFEYCIPNDMIDIYDIECPGCDDILYLHYLNHNLDGIVTIIHKDFLSMTDDELQKLKEGQQGL